MDCYDKFIVSFIIGMSLLSGCTLEALTQFGEVCPGVSYIQMEEDKCVHDSCSWGNTYFSLEKCPEDQPFCIAIPGEDVYCASMCPERTHELSDDFFQELKEKEADAHRCEPDTTKHCGPTRKNCAEESGWISGSCVDQQCKAKKCTEFYREDNGTCKLYGACCGKYCAHCTDVKNSKTGKKWVCSGEDKDADCIDTCPEGMINHDGLCIQPQSG